jgi:peptidoglycan L-alanyl-D-glutamate endopeptidase CwlK
MASRRIEALSKQLQPLASKFINTANAVVNPMGAAIILTCTYRSNDEQAILYAQGRSTPGKKVTNAKPGQSKHNCVDSRTGKPAAEAFDIAILINGKLNWDIDNVIWQIAGSIGEKLGLEWAGHWSKFKEGPHFQLKQQSEG